MIFNVACVGAVALAAYIWSRGGVFAAMLHLLCTLVAGAVAFGLWEPIAYALIDASPVDGFFSFLESIAWPLALLVPFAVTLFALRMMVDNLVPGNLSNQSILNLVGGGALGAFSMYIAVGMLAIGFGFFRWSDSLGFNAVEKRSNGSVARGGSLWIKADNVTAQLYKHLSSTSLYSGENLAEWYPDLDLAGHAMQYSVDGGKGRNAIKRDDFEVKNGFRVGADGGMPPSRLLLDLEGVEQRYQDLDGNDAGPSNLYGYFIEFGPGAKENIGQVAFSNGQIRLVAHSESGAAVTLHPIAAFGQATSEDNSLYRFLYEGEDDVIPSVGGASNVNMGFEFVVPNGYTPAGLYVKNTRVDVTGMEYNGYASPAQRLSAITGGRFGGAATTVSEIDRSEAVDVGVNSSGRNQSSDDLDSGLTITSRVPFFFQTTQRNGLTLNEDNEIVSGSSSWFASELRANQNVPPNLRVDSFAVGSDRVMIQLNVSDRTAGSVLGRAARSVERILPPQLVDTRGIPYPCVGYIYEDEQQLEIKIDAGNPIRAMQELPSMSRSRTDQELTLLFLVSRGVELDAYLIGQKAIVTFDPPVNVQASRR